MIWALLFSLIFGSGEDVFFIPKLDKYVSRHLNDKELVEEFKQARKQTKKLRKKFQKTNSKRLKEIRKLNKTFVATIDDFNKVGKSLEEHRIELQKIEIQELLNLKTYISEEKWTLVFLDAQRDISKLNKKNNKKIMSFEKNLVKIERAIKRKLPENEKSADFYKQYSEYSKELLIRVTEYFNYSEDENNVIMEYNSSRKDYEELARTINTYRREIYKEFVESHFALVEATTEKEFQSIIKQLNKTF